jgi:hypothetical protein
MLIGLIGLIEMTQCSIDLGTAEETSSARGTSWNVVECLGYSRLQARHLEVPGRHDPRLNVPNPRSPAFKLDGVYKILKNVRLRTRH